MLKMSLMVNYAVLLVFLFEKTGINFWSISISFFWTCFSNSFFIVVKYM